SVNPAAQVSVIQSIDEQVEEYNDAMMKRLQRTTRCTERRNFSLTDRDAWILEAIGRMRFLTTTQIARLAFNKSLAAAQKRLRKLFNAGLVRVWVPDL